MGTILIAYISKTGSTRDAAVQIAEKLNTSGKSCEIKSLDQISNIDNFDSIILGSPINGMNLVPEMTQFIIKNKNQLKGKVIGVFALSYMFGAGRPAWNKAISRNVKKAAEALEVKHQGVFYGKINEKMPGPARFIFGLSKDLPLDRTDMKGVDAWAKEIASNT